MKENLILYRKHLLERLVSVVDDLEQVAAAIPPQKWHEPEENGETPHRALAHLRAIEEQALSMRLQRILDEMEPYLPLFHDNQWMAAHYDPEEPSEKILTDFRQLRRAELEMIKDLPQQGWNRTARHPWWGVKTLQWWVEQTLHYSEEHLQQIRAIHIRLGTKGTAKPD